jgi:type II restriction enzyme
MGEPIEIPQPPPVTDRDGNVRRSTGDGHQPQGRRARQARLEHRGHPDRRPRHARHTRQRQEDRQGVTEQTRQKREELKEEYGLTAKQVDRDEKRTEQVVKDQVERAYTEHNIANKHLDDD